MNLNIASVNPLIGQQAYLAGTYAGIQQAQSMQWADQLLADSVWKNQALAAQERAQQIQLREAGYRREFEEAKFLRDDWYRQEDLKMRQAQFDEQKRYNSARLDLLGEKSVTDAGAARTVWPNRAAFDAFKARDRATISNLQFHQDGSISGEVSQIYPDAVAGGGSGTMEDDAQIWANMQLLQSLGEPGETVDVPRQAQPEDLGVAPGPDGGEISAPLQFSVGGMPGKLMTMVPLGPSMIGRSGSSSGSGHLDLPKQTIPGATYEASGSLDFGDLGGAREYRPPRDPWAGHEPLYTPADMEAMSDQDISDSIRKMRSKMAELDRGLSLPGTPKTIQAALLYNQMRERIGRQRDQLDLAVERLEDFQEKRLTERQKAEEQSEEVLWAHDGIKYTDERLKQLAELYRSGGGTLESIGTAESDSKAKDSRSRGGKAKSGEKTPAVEIDEDTRNIGRILAQLRRSDPVTWQAVKGYLQGSKEETPEVPKKRWPDQSGMIDRDDLHLPPEEVYEPRDHGSVRDWALEANQKGMGDLDRVAGLFAKAKEVGYTDKEIEIWVRHADSIPLEQIEAMILQRMNRKAPGSTQTKDIKGEREKRIADFMGFGFH